MYLEHKPTQHATPLSFKPVGYIVVLEDSLLSHSNTIHKFPKRNSFVSKWSDFSGKGKAFLGGGDCGVIKAHRATKEISKAGAN